MIKPEIAGSRVATVCGDCGAVDRLLIHQVRHRGSFRRLCTSCVLRLHPQSFCPTCFQVYPPPPPNDAAVTCVKCYSSSHSNCVSAGPAPPPTPYICPLCVSPNSPIFKLKSANEANLKTGEGMSEECRVMDRDSAKKLVAAAKIASSSMNRAAIAAKAEAERRAREAAVARKRAKEALEHVTCLVMREKLRKKEAAMGSGNGGIGSSVGYAGGGFNMARVKFENNANNGGQRNGTAGTSVTTSVVVEEKINANVDRISRPKQVLAALSTVELRENGKTGRVQMQNAVQTQGAAGSGQAVMDLDEKGRTMVNAGENMEEGIAKRNDGNDNHDKMFAEIETAAENLNMQGMEQDGVDIEDNLDKAVANQMDCKENGSDGVKHGNTGAL